MICPNCEHETKEGKFCTNCGVHLNLEEAAVAEEGESQSDTTLNNRDFSSTVSTVGKHFASFFMHYLKSPHKARFATQQDIIPAIISIVLFALAVTISFYVVVTSQVGSYFLDIGFLDGFIIPFIQYLLLFAFIIILTFISTKLTAQHMTLQETVTKVGIYTIPFLLIFLAGILLTWIRIPFFSVLIPISLLGPVIFIPSFILLESKEKEHGYDRVYVLIAFYFISFVVMSFLLQDMIGRLLGGLFGGLMGDFFQGY
ncbi:zinc ribbon domain-containing protein [Virgibacillus dokdonensis]|uniref:zinc ribbon domain-containing protein n=1 Tax=Virgibacillus dokdonensis TaxID=302167 RepID=UPI00098B307C|nr:zinc ribbon domain-containing protein [Virgibacillus dokdonensis]